MTALGATTEMVDVALAYADLGWKVLRIRPMSKKPNIGSDEYGTDWPDYATDDLDTIEGQWTEPGHLDDNIGIKTGPDSGFWVLDVDVKRGEKGPDTLRQLQEEHGKLPKTVTAYTGSGGVHFLFKWDPARPVPCHKIMIGSGLETKGQGGQIVVHHRSTQTMNGEGESDTSGKRVETRGPPRWPMLPIGSTT